MAENTEEAITEVAITEEVTTAAAIMEPRT